METGAEPEEVRVTVCVAVLFSTTWPNDRFVELMVRPGWPLLGGAAAATCIANISETPPAVAVNFTGWVLWTDEEVALNPALLAP
jgi:hypothetical protein